MIALTALVVVLAGCSDSSEPETEETPSADASASASESPREQPERTRTEELPETSASGVPADVEEGVLARLDAADGLLGTAPDADPPVLGLEEFNAGRPRSSSTPSRSAASSPAPSSSSRHPRPPTRSAW